jgi:hemerythrin
MTTATFREVDSLGIEIIDAQHRRFYVILGRLVAARAAGQSRQAVQLVLDDMVSYVDEHFGLEERYMLEFGYDDYAAHRQLHAGFVRKIMTTQQEYRRAIDGLDDGLIAYLAGWFTAHIRGEDPKYVELFKANGL